MSDAWITPTPMTDAQLRDPRYAPFMSAADKARLAQLNSQGSQMDDYLKENPINWDSVSQNYGEAESNRLRDLITGTRGHLGLNGRLLMSQVAQAVGGPPVYSENDIRNEALAQRAMVGFDWRKQSQDMGAAAGDSGLLDSGGYYDQYARSEAAAGNQAKAAAMQSANRMYTENAQTQASRVGNAMNAVTQWAGIKKNKRLSDAALQGQIAYNSTLARGASQSGTWGAIGGLLGAGSSLFGAIGGGGTK